MVSSDTSISTLTAFNADDGRADSAQCRRPLRVLFYLFFPGGGIGRYTHELMTRLHQIKSVEVELACLPSFHWLRDAEYPTWPGLREIGHRTPWRRRANFLIGQIANPLRLAEHARQTRPDVIHLSNVNHLTFPLWRRALEATNAMIVYTAHDIRRSKAIINRRYESKQLVRFYQWANYLFVHSRAQEEDLRSFAGIGESHVGIVPHGPYDYGRPTATRTKLRERYQLPVTKDVALFFGEIRDDKNLDLFLRAMSRNDDAPHLLVAGRFGGSQHKSVQYYRALIHSLSLQHAVTIIDRYLPDEEIPDIIEACDWMALPYSNTFSSQSGVLALAMNYRIPVLMSRTKTLAEMLDTCDIGVCIPPDDEDALASGIRAIQRRIQCGEQFEFDQYKNLYGWEENVLRTSRTYETLLRSSDK